MITPENFPQYLFDSIVNSKSCPICNSTLINSITSSINKSYCPNGDLEILINEQVIETYKPTNIDIDAGLNQIAYYSGNFHSRKIFPIKLLNPLTFDNLLFQINKINVFE